MSRVDDASLTQKDTNLKENGYYIHPEQHPLYDYASILASPKIPHHFPFSHNCTRWLLSNIVSEIGVQRILFKDDLHDFLLCKYFQIPDTPDLYIQKQQSACLERPAFSPLANLYMTPIALAIYLKQNNALESMLQYLSIGVPNSFRIKIREPGYVDNHGEHYQKDTFKTWNIATLALLRMNIDGLLLLITYGAFDPHAELLLLKKRRFDEALFYYRDFLDYAVYQLRNRPCLPVALTIQRILSTTLRAHNLNGNSSAAPIAGYNLNVFEKPFQCKGPLSNENCISVFRRLLLLILDQPYFAHEVASAMFSLLETIQKTCFFTQSSGSKLPPFCMFSEASSKTCIMVEKIHLYSRVDDNTSDFIFFSDALKCIGLMIRWYQICLGEMRVNHCDRIVNLIVRILIDTRYMPVVLEYNDNELRDHFALIEGNEANIHKSYLSEATFRNLRIHIFDVIRKDDILHKRFCNLCQQSPDFMLPSDFLERSCLKRKRLLNSFLAAPAVNKESGNENDTNINTLIFCNYSESTNRFHETYNNMLRLRQNHIRCPEKPSPDTYCRFRNGRAACITMFRCKNNMSGKPSHSNLIIFNNATNQAFAYDSHKNPSMGVRPGILKETGGQPGSTIKLPKDYVVSCGYTDFLSKVCTDINLTSSEWPEDIPKQPYEKLIGDRFTHIKSDQKTSSKFATNNKNSLASTQELEIVESQYVDKVGHPSGDIIYNNLSQICRSKALNDRKKIRPYNFVPPLDLPISSDEDKSVVNEALFSSVSVRSISR